jgi:hypothetical protein
MHDLLNLDSQKSKNVFLRHRNIGQACHTGKHFQPLQYSGLYYKCLTIVIYDRNNMASAIKLQL